MSNVTKKSPARIIWILLPLCAGSFLAGRFSAGHNTPPPTTEAPSVAIPPSPPRETTPASPEPVSLEIRPVVVASTKRWDDLKWERLSAQTTTHARNLEMAALLEILAATDPHRAVALAQAERNLKTRETLLGGVLRGWGSASPGDAVNWALALPDENVRDAAVAAAFNGAAAKPSEAINAVKKLAADNPGEATSCGRALIDALCDTGNYSAAIQVVNAGADGVQRSILTAEAYSRWAALQPEQAAQAASALTDPTARNEALHGVIGGWAQADPAALTHFLAGQPSGGDRGSMIGQALQSWVRFDPEAAAVWINDREASSDYDEGVAAVASVNFVKSDLALNWAETISNPKLRSETVANVLHGWVLEDLQAAKQYFASTKNLLPEDRQRIGEIIATAETNPAQ